MTPRVSAADLCPRPLEVRDAAALIGVLARLVGESMAGQLDEDLSSGIAARLEREELLSQPASSPVLQEALSDLVERIRYALGEYDTPPVSSPN